MLHEDAEQAREIVDELYLDFEWYDIPSWSKHDVKRFKELVVELIQVSRKIKS